MKIQKRDLETGDTKPQGSATLKDTAFDIISLNDNSVLVEGKLYKKNEVVKTIRTDIEGVASTSSDLLPYGKFRIVESEAPDGYLTDGAKPIDFTITENGKIVDLTDKAHSIYNQIKRGDIEGVKIGAGTHKRLADVPFRITSTNAPRMVPSMSKSAGFRLYRMTFGQASSLVTFVRVGTYPTRNFATLGPL